MNAHQLRVVHLVLAILWGTVGMAATVFWLADSILWVGMMSAYALVVGHLAAYDAARAEES